MNTFPRSSLQNHVLVDVPAQYRPSYRDPLLAASEESAPMQHYPTFPTDHRYINGYGYPDYYGYISNTYGYPYPNASYPFMPGHRNQFVGCAFDGGESLPHSLREKRRSSRDIDHENLKGAIRSEQRNVPPLTPLPPPATSFSLVGESFITRDTIEDIFRPRFLVYPYPLRSSPSNRENGVDSGIQDPPVDHLDITKTWKGLSSGQAEELIFWENIFRRVLGDFLHQQLEFLREETGSFVNFRQSRSSILSIEDDSFHYVPISVLDLVLAMVCESKNSHRRYRWFVSTGNLYKVVAQFVRTHDCFIGGYKDSTTPDHSDGLKIGVKLREPEPSLARSLSQPTDTIAQIIWNPGYLSFEEFDLAPKEGQEFCLSPRYHAPFTTPSTALEASLHENITYTTSARWLHWDARTRAFYGTVPYFYQAQEMEELGAMRSQDPKISYGMRIIVRATVVDRLDEKARFEQSIRSRVSINAAPNWTSSLPKIMNDLYSPEKVGKMHDCGIPGLPLPLSKHRLSEKLDGGVYGSFKLGMSSVPTCGDARCYNCAPPHHRDLTTRGEGTFMQQQPDEVPTRDKGVPGQQGNRNDNEHPSSSDTLGNVGLSNTTTRSGCPATHCTSSLGRYRVLSAEERIIQHPPCQDCMPHRPKTFHPHRRGTEITTEDSGIGLDDASIPPRPGRAFDTRYNHGSSLAPNIAEECVMLMDNSQTGQVPFPRFDDNAAQLEVKYSPWQNWKKYSSLRGIDQSIEPNISQYGSESLKRIAKRSKLSSEESHTSIFAEWMLRDSTSKDLKLPSHRDSVNAAERTKRLGDILGREISSGVPDRYLDGSLDSYPDHSSSSTGSLISSGLDEDKGVDSQVSQIPETGPMDDAESKGAVKTDKDRRKEKASEEAAKVVNHLTAAITVSKSNHARNNMNQYLVPQEHKAAFVQMLRERDEQAHEDLGSDFEDIFFAASTDGSEAGSDDRSDRSDGINDSDEGVPIHSTAE